VHPVLITIGRFHLYTYGAMIALGIFVGLTLAKREATRQGIDANRIFDITFYVLITALIGSRLLYVGLNYEEYLAHPVRILKLWEGGLVFYGGLVPAVAVGLWYMQRHAMPVWQVADIFAPSMAIGHAFGRLGCFFAGC
jgi:phosphatidylglycerol:prolipoprotein diacylglycerol transferase